MSEPLKYFFKIIHKENVDDMILDTPIINNTIEQLKDYGKDLEQSLKNSAKKQQNLNKPIKPSGSVPTYQEAAFIKPDKETTLYNVTNKEQSIPAKTENSKFCKHLSYSVRGLTAAATYKEGENSYSLLAGEKLGINWRKDLGTMTQNIRGEFNIRNKKTNIRYTLSNPLQSYSVSLFNQKGNRGISAGYSNSKGIQSGISIDRNSAAINTSYKTENAELGAYAKLENGQNIIGIMGRICLQ